MLPPSLLSVWICTNQCGGVTALGPKAVSGNGPHMGALNGTLSAVHLTDNGSTLGCSLSRMCPTGALLTVIHINRHAVLPATRCNSCQQGPTNAWLWHTNPVAHVGSILHAPHLTSCIARQSNCNSKQPLASLFQVNHSSYTNHHTHASRLAQATNYLMVRHSNAASKALAELGWRV